MSIPELCIRRPVMTTLLMVAFVIFGAMGYRSLPVSELPRVDYPVIQVQASLPGTDPETMAATVASVLEAQFSNIPGIEAMNSTSGTGNTRITILFALDRNIDTAAQDVVAAIAAAQRRLPPAMPSPPVMRKVNPADFPVLFIAMSSPTLPLQEVNEWAETQLAQRISQISGVAQVNVFGSQKRAIRVHVNPDLMASRGVGIDEVERAVRQANSNQPTGIVAGPDKSHLVRTTGQLSAVEGFLEQIVVVRNGAPIRLRELGSVIESVENDKVAAWFRTDRAIILAIYRQPGTNTIETVDNVRRVLPTFQASLPAAIDLGILFDRTLSIRHSVEEVQFTLVLASVLVILVIFLFLRNLSATLIPSLALPISIIGTFGLMFAFGYSLDNLSLLALTLAVGFVVDDAIVMLENIVRHIEEGMEPFEAALKGSREIGFTIISMTVSLVAVFIPVMFMGGIVGRLLHEFAVTITAAIVVSGIVSLTLTPMMCSRFVKSHKGVRHNMLYRITEAGFQGMLQSYRWSLALSMRYKPAVVAVFFGTVVATVLLFRDIPKDFLPTEDTGQIRVFTAGPQDASFELMVRLQQQVAALVRQNPNIEACMSTVGAGGPRAAGNEGQIFCRLKARDKRPNHASEIIAQLRRTLPQITGIRTFASIPPPIQLTAFPTRADFQYTMQSLETETLFDFAKRFEDRVARDRDIFAQVSSDLDIAAPTVVVNIDRNKAAALGLSMEQVEIALASAFGSRQISTIYTANNQYQVILEVEPRFRNDPRALDKLHIRSGGVAGGGVLIPLGAVASLSQSVGPLSVSHAGQLPSVTISFNLQRGVALGTAVARLRAIEAEMRLPPVITPSLQGAAQAFETSTQGLGVLLFLAIFVVYIVLGVLYESFIHPLTILSGLPSAAVGALITLMWFNTPLSLYAFVGVIMLVGIVKKNAIMMIDFALERKRQGETDPEKAIFEACMIRFRPIMMTTMAALLGTLPIALSVGGGAESRVPLGLAVVGGLALSQILTLYLTPVIFVYLDRFQTWLGRRKSKDAPPVVPVPAAAE